MTILKKLNYIITLSALNCSALLIIFYPMIPSKFILKNYLHDDIVHVKNLYCLVRVVRIEYQ